MLDILGAIALTLVYASMVGVLVGFSSAKPTAKAGAFAIAAVWAVLIVTFAAFGGFQSRILGPVPAPPFASAILLATLLGFWRFSGRFRESLLNVPLPASIGINTFRILGVFFLILHDSGRLSAPFSTSAGWGDIAAGILAIPLAIVAREPQRFKKSILAWNIFGTLDLIVAISLGALSAQGTPIRVFTEGPGTFAMATLPWTMIPTLAVPIYLLNHLLIFTKVRSAAEPVELQNRTHVVAA